MKKSFWKLSLQPLTCCDHVVPVGGAVNDRSRGAGVGLTGGCGNFDTDSFCWQLQRLLTGVHVTEMKRRRERRNHGNHNLQHRTRVRQGMKLILKSSSAA